jgi:hypothetical protein
MTTNEENLQLAIERLGAAIRQWEEARERVGEAMNLLQHAEGEMYNAKESLDFLIGSRVGEQLGTTSAVMVSVKKCDADHYYDDQDIPF